MAETTDVVIVGGGIAGLCTAYYLARAGVTSTIIEKDSLGSHASGFAFGELTPSRGSGIPGPLAPLAMEGLRMHPELTRALREDTGIDPGFHLRQTLVLMFTEEELAAERATLPAEQGLGCYGVRWVEAAEARAMEPRISDRVLAAVCLEGPGEVDPYRLVLALAGAVEKRGCTIRTGHVTGLQVEAGRVRTVRLETGEIPCDRAVLATGPWAAEAATWIGTAIPVRPLKGEIIRLRASGPPIERRVSRGHHYAASKPDGLVWAGTTLEEAGFDDGPTEQARQSITDGLVAMLPSLLDAQLVEHTACLRPVTPDWLPILGPVPGVEGVYLATGAGRKGILLGPPMGKAVADLITTGATDITLDAFEVGRFGGDELTP